MPLNKRTHKVYEFDYTAEASQGDYDSLPKLFEQGPAMVVNARAMVNHANSYRGVLVGSAALTHNTHDNRLRIYVGHNDTPYRGARKYCAEMRAIGRSISEGYTRREAVVTAGPTDGEVIESIIGAPARILPPCQQCTELVEDSTIVISIGAEDDIFGVQTGKHLKEIHPAINPLKKKQRGKTEHPFVNEPVYNLSTLKWHQAEDVYGELAASLDPEAFNQLSELRLARAALAITALTANVSAA